MKKNNSKSQNATVNATVKTTTSVVCPVCGAEFAIAEHEHKVSGMAIGKDSGLGKVELPLAKEGNIPNKADARLEALRKAGVDTTNMFAMQSASGDGMLVRVVDGVPSMIDDSDPIYAALAKGNYIPDRHLFRRWVMAQMFHMLKDGDFTKELHNKGYEYTWKMTEEEFRVQARMAVNDKENFAMRNYWFNKDVAVAMADDYIKLLHNYVYRLRTRKCKGIPYKRVSCKNIFCEDLNKTIFHPLALAALSISRANTPKALYEAVKKFNGMRIKLEWRTRQCPVWVDAYKGSGAYFTMRNMIMFHGCNIKNNKTVQANLNVLEEYKKAYKCEGWRMLGVLKELIEDNGIDIKAKIASWGKE